MFHKAGNRFRSEGRSGRGRERGKKGGEREKNEQRSGEWLALLPTEAKFSTLLKAVSRGETRRKFSYLEEGCN